MILKIAINCDQESALSQRGDRCDGDRNADIVHWLWRDANESIRVDRQVLMQDHAFSAGNQRKVSLFAFGC